VCGVTGFSFCRDKKGRFCCKPKNVIDTWDISCDMTYKEILAMYQPGKKIRIGNVIMYREK
jgi:hypothetical protein